MSEKAKDIDKTAVGMRVLESISEIYFKIYFSMNFLVFFQREAYFFIFFISLIKQL